MRMNVLKLLAIIINLMCNTVVCIEAEIDSTIQSINGNSCLNRISSEFPSYFNNSAHIILDKDKDLTYYQANFKKIIAGSNVGSNFQLPLNSIPIEYTMSKSFETSIINHGNPDQFLKLNQKLQSNQCIIILCVGGSITCGGSQNKVRPSGPDGPKDAWPKKLQHWFNQYMPVCSRSGSSSSNSKKARRQEGSSGNNNINLNQHSVLNRCVGGAGTSHWVDSFASWKSDPTHAVHTADLIIVESSVNDFASHNDLLSSTELLILLLKSLNHKPAMMWLGLSTIEVLPWMGRGNSVMDHKLLTLPYQIPHISITDGFYPFNSELKKYWYLDIYRSDAVSHVSCFGHALIGVYLLKFIQLSVCRSAGTLHPSGSVLVPTVNDYNSSLIEPVTPVVLNGGRQAGKKRGSKLSSTASAVATIILAIYY